MALGIRGFPNLYEIDRYESLSPLSAESTSSSSLCNYFGNPSLVCMHRDLGIDMKTSVAKETSLSSVCLLVCNQRGCGAVSSASNRAHSSKTKCSLCECSRPAGGSGTSATRAKKR